MITRSSRTLPTAVLLCLIAVPAQAQKPLTVELGAFGRFTGFDYSLSLTDHWGIGGRLGVFVAPNLAIEATGSFTPTHIDVGPTGDVSFYPFAARAVYNLPVREQTSLLIGAGLLHNEYRDSRSASDNGATALLGIRQQIVPMVSLRIEGVADYVPSPANVVQDNWNLAAKGGFSVLLGGTKFVDSDGDGVADKKDQCADTAMGETVDAVGCPLDADKDGVSDRNDRCAATPAGEPVDAAGCPRDADGDGVRDTQDRCANTPAGEAVDANGCPRDSDNDGVSDARDRCAGTAAGVKVDANGCELDSDGDGVADSADRCASTPRGAQVDSNGCPKDTDGDSVFDGLDRCPGSPAGQPVDAVGCPVLFAEKATSVVLEGVTFATGSANLTDQARAILDRVAQSLVGNPDIKVEVGGHTDNTGNAATNVRLSQTRAESVRQYLIDHGVAADHVTAKGYGSTQPIADNRTATGRAANRRVALQRIEQ